MYGLQGYRFNRPLEEIAQAGQVGNVQHAVKGNWIYELPFGRDKKFGGGAGSFMDALIGGWSIDGVARIQTGETLNFGNVRMIGMSVDEFGKAIKLQMGPSGQMSSCRTTSFRTP